MVVTQLIKNENAEIFNFEIFIMDNDICITLDYELCLGNKTGSVVNSLILPTDELTKIFDKYNVKATIFVDSSYLFALSINKNKHPRLENDYNMIVSQLKRLSENGHSIQLHIHPQWYYSHFNGSEWCLDFEHYKLSDMQEADVQMYFKKSKLLLEAIIGKKVVAFRAGGFSIQTYPYYYKLLVTNNIKIDTSVVPGVVEKSRYQWYDFRNAPNSIYKFRDDITKIDEDGKIFEVPVSVVKYASLYYLYLRKRIESTHNSFKPFTEGQGISWRNPFYDRFWGLFKQLFKVKIIGASVDGFLSCMLPLIYERFKTSNKEGVFVILGHPKGASPESIKYTEEFIKQTVNNSSYKKIEELI
jgi:peptidoglycan/xylan/chitin deacetylase (PgdA/CDA1 family)